MDNSTGRLPTRIRCDHRDKHTYSDICLCCDIEPQNSQHKREINDRPDDMGDTKSQNLAMFAKTIPWGSNTDDNQIITVEDRCVQVTIIKTCNPGV